MFSGSSNSYQVSQSIYELLEHEKYTIKTYQIKNSSLEEAQKAVEIVAEEKPSFLVAVGGGSIIDVAKYASLPSSPKLAHIPYINVPTLPSHDGIASPFIFLQDKKSKKVKERPTEFKLGNKRVIFKKPSSAPPAKTISTSKKKMSSKKFEKKKPIKTKPVKFKEAPTKPVKTKTVKKEVETITL